MHWRTYVVMYVLVKRKERNDNNYKPSGVYCKYTSIQVNQLVRHYSNSLERTLHTTAVANPKLSYRMHFFSEPSLLYYPNIYSLKNDDKFQSADCCVLTTINRDSTREIVFLSPIGCLHPHLIIGDILFVEAYFSSSLGTLLVYCLMLCPLIQHLLNPIP